MYFINSCLARESVQQHKSDSPCRTKILWVSQVAKQKPGSCYPFPARLCCKQLIREGFELWLVDQCLVPDSMQIKTRIRVCCLFSKIKICQNTAPPQILTQYPPSYFFFSDLLLALPVHEMNHSNFRLVNESFTVRVI